jgi:serine/threonine-protein kinase PRP4
LDRPKQSAENLAEEYRGSAKRAKEVETVPTSLPLGKPAPPDARDRFADFSMPAFRVLDDATYQKKIKDEMETLERLKNEEENLEKISEQRRARLAALAASSTSSSSSNVAPHIHAPSNASAPHERPEPQISKEIVKPAQVALKEVDSDDDMFSESFADVKPSLHSLQGHEKSDFGVSSSKGVSSSNRGDLAPDHAELNAMVANGGRANDDDDGYYNFRVGELLCGGRYEVLGYYGKGMYSSVIRAMRKPLAGGGGGAECEVAIKLLRNNAHMKRSGKKEVKVLRRLEEVAEARGVQNFCLKLAEHFEEQGHMCLVFEAMDMNLTEVVKMYGHHVGLSIKAVRSYAFKMLKALLLLKNADIIHADIKPDNILVSKDRNEVKLADFGTAFESQEAEETNQLVSRFYRAPEIIIGLFPHSYPLDMFSLGCCLFEIATGRYLLNSNSDNHHLKLIMEISGPFPKKILLQAQPAFAAKHFSLSQSDGEFRFLEHFPDPLDSSNVLLRHLQMPSKPSRSILTELLESYDASSLNNTELAWVQRLAHLITQCLVLDPKKRITPEEALQHDLF